MKSMSAHKSILILVAFLMIGSFVFMFGVNGKSTQEMSIELRKIKCEKGDLVIGVTFINLTKNEIRIIDPSVGIGKEFCSFLIRDPKGAKIRILRRVSDLTGPPLNEVVIPPQGKIEYSFNLMDNTWSWPFTLAAKSVTSIEVEVDFPQLNQEKKNPWILGSFSSAPLELGTSIWDIRGYQMSDYGL